MLRFFNGSAFSIPCFRYFMKTCLLQRVHGAASHAFPLCGITEDVFRYINVRSFPRSSFSVTTDRVSYVGQPYNVFYQYFLWCILKEELRLVSARISLLPANTESTIPGGRSTTPQCWFCLSFWQETVAAPITWK